MAGGSHFKATDRVTPSTHRLRANVKRSRKQLKAKRSTEKPSWTEALKRRYMEAELAKNGKPVDERPWKARQIEDKRSRELAQVRRGGRLRGSNQTGADESEEDDDEAEEVEGDDDDDEPLEVDANPEAGVEVQDDIDEEKMTRLNAAQPMHQQLFLKGLPNDATEEDIEQNLRRFGKIKKVFVVKNKFTGIPTGSAFVHFADDAGPSAALEYATINMREMTSATKEEEKSVAEGLSRHKAKELQYKMKHAQTVSREPFLYYGQTRVNVMVPMTRTDAQEFVGSMHKGGKKAKKTPIGADDPRNLYLLREGLVEAGTPAAKGLRPQQLQALLRDFEERTAQLKNVNYFVSKTRLSVRNLPKDYEAAKLRKLVAEKAREFYERNPTQKDKSTWGKFGPIKQCRVLVDARGQSRRYGFIELCDHNVALYVLRMLNNNPELFGPANRLVVHFSVENQMALQKLAHRKEVREARAEAEKDPAAGPAADSADEQRSYRQMALAAKQKMQADHRQRMAGGGNMGAMKRRKQQAKRQKNGGAKAGKAPNRKKGGR